MSIMRDCIAGRQLKAEMIRSQATNEPTGIARKESPSLAKVTVVALLFIGILAAATLCHNPDLVKAFAISGIATSVAGVATYKLIRFINDVEKRVAEEAHKTHETSFERGLLI